MKWDSEQYKKQFSFVNEYGNAVTDLIRYQEGMKVLDLGCGNGTLTKRLADKGYHIIGMDQSIDMIELAKKDYPDIEFFVGDATNFKLNKKVDVIFSNAVFHWIHDQDALLECIHDNLKPGGELVCEFGGYHNCESVHLALEKAFHKRGYHYPRLFYFPTIGEYSSKLENHGFLVDYAVLFERDTLLQGEDGMLDWINMFMKNTFKDVREEDIEEIKKEAVEELANTLYIDRIWHCDYVRIKVRAKRL